MRSAILGFVSGYRLFDLKPFVESWKRHSCNSDLFLFQSNLDSETTRALTSFGVCVRDGSYVLKPDRQIATSRYFAYRDFLARHESIYDGIFLTDVRDVVFQSDPFPLAMRGGVAWLAAEDKKIGEEPYNSHWINAGYGSSIFDLIKHEIISCSGTTIGATAAIIRYVDLMCAEVDRGDGSRSIQGMDQGYHNFILYKLRPMFAHLDRLDEISNTLGITESEKIDVDQNGNIVSIGSPFVAPIIHQWDRHPRLTELLYNRYA